MVYDKRRITLPFLLSMYFEAIDPTAVNHPVSYTHLDVYKRQHNHLFGAVGLLKADAARQVAQAELLQMGQLGALFQLSLIHI